VNGIGVNGFGGVIGWFIRNGAGASVGAGSGAEIGAGAGGALSGCVVNAMPAPQPPNGPLTSSAISTFGPVRRASNAGFKRGKISFNGRLIILLSSAPPEFAKKSGASWRSSPKEIFTAPNASCEITISTGK